MIKKNTKIHFVGIGGIGMCGIAEILLNLGYKISGSDIKETSITHRLEQKGIKIYYSHKAENIKDVDVVVFSSAIFSDNDEIIAAKNRKITVIPRAEMLAELMRAKYSIAISGSHGKTTTTSMISLMFSTAGLDPTMIIGGKLNSIGGVSAKLGKGEFLIAEADESDGSFLHLHPTIALVTNIDKEHLPYYKNLYNIKTAFVEFINHIPFYGTAILCLDDTNIQSILHLIVKKYITYGIYTSADIIAKDIKSKNYGSAYKAFYKNKLLGEIKLNVPGKHNILNSLGSIIVGLELGLEFKTIKQGLEEFTGVERRFQIKKQSKNIVIVDDYAHHPKEIEATLKATKENWDKQIVCIFQPHRYTRTNDMLEEFTKVFHNADVLIITEIYSAGEFPIEGINGEFLANIIKKYGHKNVIFIKEKKDIVDFVINNFAKDALIITMGAGDVYKIGDEIIKEITF
ncbi:MAG: UDP-N-acetylmuramate--L-alanine ligase [bacterium]